MSKRESVAALLRAGRTVPEICRDLENGRTMVFTVKKLMKEGKDLAPKANTGRPRTARAPRAAAGIFTLRTVPS